jgi:hypothetical protein
MFSVRLALRHAASILGLASVFVLLVAVQEAHSIASPAPADLRQALGTPDVSHGSVIAPSAVITNGWTNLNHGVGVEGTGP